MKRWHRSGRGWSRKYSIVAVPLRNAACVWGLALLIGAHARMGRSQQPDPVPAGRANRLAGETSPYLLMHSRNPVDWYPWGQEAFEKAKRERKVVFLSIGYSSCHWCHVMERESFLDAEVAAFLNQHFVCVKVDREERPDVDQVYMTALQLFHQLSGSGRGGGWPLTMFLTPEGEPFFGGTYFPARDGDRGMATGFLTVIRRLHEVWQEKEERLRQDAKTLTRYVKAELEATAPATNPEIRAELVDSVFAALREQFDDEHGGFGFSPADADMPKFPEPANLFFLVDRAQRLRSQGRDAEPALRMLRATLDHMAQGGIRDHLGGGFHRYSVDRFWRIPHFEKMLYDNGQLLSVFAEAYGLTGDEEYRRVTEEVAEFVLRELTDTRGGFYAALDADSEEEEGKYYRWEAVEVRQSLSPDGWELFAPLYQLAGAPNFEERYYVPQLAAPRRLLAKARGCSEAELEQQLRPLRARLLEVRSRRVRPLTDTKILVAWNGLMIRGLADAGRILEQPRYLDAARRAARFLLAELRTPEGRLLSSYSQGRAKLNAYVNDYAFLVDGLLALHRATREPEWLDAAEQLTDRQLALFWDELGQGFYFTSDDHESLLARIKELADNVLPAGNSVSAGNLLYLAEHTGRAEYRDKARGALQSALSLLERSPTAAPRLATVVAQWLADAAREQPAPP